VEDPTKREDKVKEALGEVSHIMDLTNRMENNLFQLVRDQRFFRTRENRNFDTVKSTEGRIFWLSLMQNGFIVFVAVAQVFVIQTFFSKGSGRGRV
jgi:hypothetical protein